MIMILILAFLIIGIGMYIAIPTLIDVMVDAYDEWNDVLGRIQRRRNK